MSTLAANDRLSPTYIADAAQTDFAGDFPVLLDPTTGEPYGVAIRRVRAGVETILTLGVGFTIPSRTATTFVARLTTGATAGDEIQVYGVTPPARDRAHTSGSALRTETLEGDAMQFAAALQEAGRDLARTTRVPLGEAGLELPAAATRAGMIQEYDEDGASKTDRSFDDVVTAAGAEVGASALEQVAAAGAAQVVVVNNAAAEILTPVTGTLAVAEAQVIGEGGSIEGRETEALDLISAQAEVERLSILNLQPYASNAQAMSNGVSSVAVTAGGSGGTNGVHTWTTTGGAGSGSYGTLTIAGGAVTQVTVEHRGVSYTSAPTIVPNAATVGSLTGQTLTAALSQNQPPGTYWRIPVTGGQQVVQNVAGSAVGGEVYPELTFVAAQSLFPGRFASTVTPAETAALSRVERLTLYGANPSKVYLMKYLYWKDSGTRFRATVMQADDVSGTNAADVASYTLSSGADAWTGVREITLAEVSSSGITGTFVMSFTDTTAMAMNLAPSVAADYQHRRLSARCLDAGTARTADLTTRITAIATPLLPTAPGQRKPFLDTHDATGTAFTNAILRAFVKNVWVYGSNRSDSIRMSYLRLSTSATCYIDFTDEAKGRIICRWLGAGVMAFASRPRFVRAETVTDLTVFSGEFAILELDWSVLTATVEGPLSTMTRGGLHADCLHSLASCQWWARNPRFTETIPVGPARTYTTPDAAIAALTRPSHPYDAILIEMDDQPADYETPKLVLPDFVGLKGPGMYATAGLINDNPLTTEPTLERSVSSHVFDLRITSDSGDGTTDSGEYAVHHDPSRYGSYGSDGGGQRWAIMGGMRNVLLVGGVNQDVNLFGGGFNSGLLEIWHNVKGKRLNPTAANAWFSAHDTGPELSSGGIYEDNSQQLLPAIWEMHNCSAPAMFGSSVQVLSQAGTETINYLVLDDCDFRLVTQHVSSGTAYLWVITGNHAGAVVQTGPTDDIYPDVGKLRLVSNDTGSTIATGRAVKLIGADTIALCGAGEKPDGWTIESIADGAIGQINTAKSIADQYLDGADASTGDWGLNSSGQVDYAASVKLGRTSGSVVTVW